MFDMFFSGLQTACEVAYRFIAQFIQSILMMVPDTNISILPVLYVAGWNLAVSLGYSVFVFAVVLSMAFFRKGGRLVKALVVWLILSLAPNIWVPLVDELVAFGGTLGHAAQFYTSEVGGNSIFSIMPVVDSPLWSLLGLTGSLIWGGALAFFLWSYTPFIILFKFLGPVALVMTTVGERSRKLANIILSVGLVATFLGRPWAIFFISLGDMAMQTMPGGHTGLGAMFYITTAYALAFASQVTLLFACYHVSKAVGGWVGARVQGFVETRIRGVVKVDSNQVRREQSASIQPVPVKIVSENMTMKEQAISAAQDAAKQAMRKAAHAATKVAAGVAMAYGQPKTGAVIYKAGGKFFGSKRDENS